MLMVKTCKHSFQQIKRFVVTGDYVYHQPQIHNMRETMQKEERGRVQFLKLFLTN